MNNKNEVISNLINKSNPKRSIFKNILKAFIIGGLICLIAQIINGVLNIFLDEKISSILATIIMIFLSSFLTAFGVYDKIGQFAGAGTIIPITGFANSVTSSAMEYKSEGIVTGIINNMLKLAGSIIVTGIISAFIVSTILFLLGA
jgi:stage V sporulation protein AC